MTNEREAIPQDLLDAIDKYAIAVSEDEDDAALQSSKARAVVIEKLRAWQASLKEMQSRQGEAVAFGWFYVFADGSEEFRRNEGTRPTFHPDYQDCPSRTVTLYTHPPSQPVELTIPVKAQWLVDSYDGTKDHACKECVPHGDMLISGFQCYFHRALSVIAADRKARGG